MFPGEAFVARSRFHAGIDHHKGCRPEQRSSVGVPLPNCRASLPPGIFLMAGVGLGEISILAGEVTLPVQSFLPVGHG